MGSLPKYYYSPHSANCVSQGKAKHVTFCNCPSCFSEKAISFTIASALDLAAFASAFSLAFFLASSSTAWTNCSRRPWGVEQIHSAILASRVRRTGSGCVNSSDMLQRSVKVSLRTRSCNRSATRLDESVPRPRCGMARDQARWRR